MMLGSLQRFTWMLAAASVTVVMGGCASAPKTGTSSVQSAPASWQTQVLQTEPGSASPWRLAEPGDHLDKGAWWAVFHDAYLDALQAQALEASPTLQAAIARLAQARALLDISGAGDLPKVDAGLKGARTRTSANRPAGTASTQAVSSVQNDFALTGSVSYELDLFGRQRHDQDAAKAFEQQSQADLRNARLVISADLAVAYFGVRSLDAEAAVVQQGLQAQIRAAGVLQARYEGGAASRLDLAQQQAQMDATRTQLTLLGKQRQQLEHALATLVGVPASSFKLTEAPLPGTVPQVPTSLPSDVLQRRPDVAAAERAVAVANAQVGLAHAAWFPSLTLTASGGWEAKDIAKLMDAPSLLWAVGGSVTQAVFDGGRIRAKEDHARAGHELSLANYRQVVLRAVQETEDGLSTLNALEQAQTQSQAAVQSAQRVLSIAQDRYAGGLSTYLDVVTAQQNVLNNQRLSSQLRGQQLQATAYLIKALGGGWL